MINRINRKKLTRALMVSALAIGMTAGVVSDAGAWTKGLKNTGAAAFNALANWRINDNGVWTNANPGDDNVVTNLFAPNLGAGNVLNVYNDHDSTLTIGAVLGSNANGQNAVWNAFDVNGNVNGAAGTYATSQAAAWVGNASSQASQMAFLKQIQQVADVIHYGNTSANAVANANNSVTFGNAANLWYKIDDVKFTGTGAKPAIGYSVIDLGANAAAANAAQNLYLGASGGTAAAAALGAADLRLSVAFNVTGVANVMILPKDGTRFLAFNTAAAAINADTRTRVYADNSTLDVTAQAANAAMPLVELGTNVKNFGLTYSGTAAAFGANGTVRFGNNTAAALAGLTTGVLATANDQAITFTNNLVLAGNARSPLIVAAAANNDNATVFNNTVKLNKTSAAAAPAAAFAKNVKVRFVSTGVADNAAGTGNITIGSVNVGNIAANAGAGAAAYAAATDGVGSFVSEVSVGANNTVRFAGGVNVHHNTSAGVIRLSNANAANLINSIAAVDAPHKKMQIASGTVSTAVGADVAHDATLILAGAELPAVVEFTGVATEKQTFRIASNHNGGAGAFSSEVLASQAAAPNVPLRDRVAMQFTTLNDRVGTVEIANFRVVATADGSADQAMVATFVPGTVFGSSDHRLAAINFSGHNNAAVGAANIGKITATGIFIENDAGGTARGIYADFTSTAAAVTVAGGLQYGNVATFQAEADAQNNTTATFGIAGNIGAKNANIISSLLRINVEAASLGNKTQTAFVHHKGTNLYLGSLVASNANLVNAGGSNIALLNVGKDAIFVSTATTIHIGGGINANGGSIVLMQGLLAANAAPGSLTFATAMNNGADDEFAIQFGNAAGAKSLVYLQTTGKLSVFNSKAAAIDAKVVFNKTSALAMIADNFDTPTLAFSSAADLAAGTLSVYAFGANNVENKFRSFNAAAAQGQFNMYFSGLDFDNRQNYTFNADSVVGQNGLVIFSNANVKMGDGTFAANGRTINANAGLLVLINSDIKTKLENGSRLYLRNQITDSTVATNINNISVNGTLNALNVSISGGIADATPANSRSSRHNITRESNDAALALDLSIYSNNAKLRIEAKDAAGTTNKANVASLNTDVVAFGANASSVVASAFIDAINAALPQEALYGMTYAINNNNELVLTMDRDLSINFANYEKAKIEAAMAATAKEFGFISDLNVALKQKDGTTAIHNVKITGLGANKKFTGTELSLAGNVTLDNDNLAKLSRITTDANSSLKVGTGASLTAYQNTTFASETPNSGTLELSLADFKSAGIENYAIINHTLGNSTLTEKHLATNMVGTVANKPVHNINGALKFNPSSSTLASNENKDFTFNFVATAASATINGNNKDWKITDATFDATKASQGSVILDKLTITGARFGKTNSLSSVTISDSTHTVKGEDMKASAFKYQNSDLNVTAATTYEGAMTFVGDKTNGKIGLAANLTLNGTSAHSIKDASIRYTIAANSTPKVISSQATLVLEGVKVSMDIFKDNYTLFSFVNTDDPKNALKGLTSEYKAVKTKIDLKASDKDIVASSIATSIEEQKKAVADFVATNKIVVDNSNSQQFVDLVDVLVNKETKITDEIKTTVTSILNASPESAATTSAISEAANTVASDAMSSIDFSSAAEVSNTAAMEAFDKTGALFSSSADDADMQMKFVTKAFIGYGATSVDQRNINGKDVEAKLTTGTIFGGALIGINAESFGFAIQGSYGSTTVKNSDSVEKLTAVTMMIGATAQLNAEKGKGYIGGSYSSVESTFKTLRGVVSATALTTEEVAETLASPSNFAIRGGFEYKVMTNFAVVGKASYGFGGDIDMTTKIVKDGDDIKTKFSFSDKIDADLGVKLSMSLDQDLKGFVMVGAGISNSELTVTSAAISGETKTKYKSSSPVKGKGEVGLSYTSNGIIGEVKVGGAIGSKEKSMNITASVGFSG